MDVSIVGVLLHIRDAVLSGDRMVAPPPVEF